MLFHTPAFLIFFALLLAIIGATRQAGPRKTVLLVASYIFYMWWNPSFILLIISSTAVDFVVGKQVYESESLTRRRCLLFVSLVFNLGMLFFFKYFGLFLAGFEWALRSTFYPSVSWPEINIILPVGISFYTFQTLSYTLDIYKGELEPTDSALDFALFVAFFPQLVAGPIVRAAEFLPQLKSPHPLQFRYIEFYLILRGFLKKVLVADNLGVFVDQIMTQPEQWPSVVIWLATICFAVQIYCDFSGYSDIAIGIARVLGYSLPNNFNYPYFATSPSDFWRKWHISLSSWLRDYLYIPLGGNRCNGLQTYRNLMTTMIIGGLWHGASMNFVVWGGIHGLILVLQRVFVRLMPAPKSLFLSLLGAIVTQYFVLMTWLVFRLTDFNQMQVALRKFVIFDFDFDISGIGLGRLALFSTLSVLLSFGLLHILSWRLDGLHNVLSRRGPVTAFLAGTIAGILFFFWWPLGELPFIYFQF